MTDLPPDLLSLPSRLGVALDLDDEGRLRGVLRADPGMCERGVLPAFALVFLADVVAGVSSDTDPDAWAFTSELSVRAPLAPAPEAVVCTSNELRGGRRTTTCEAPFVVAGATWGHSFASFARVPRRPTDPPKPVFDASAARERFSGPPIDVPLRRAAGFRSVDPATGTVSVDLGPHLLNPAGALQGAMVAGLAEAAAEDLADHLELLGPGRHVVTELDVRYLVQNRATPIRTTARLAGPPSAGLVRVDLRDADERLTTAVLARVRPAPT